MAMVSHCSAQHHLLAKPVMAAPRYPAVLQCWSEQCPTDHSHIYSGLSMGRLQPRLLFVNSF